RWRRSVLGRLPTSPELPKIAKIAGSHEFRMLSNFLPLFPLFLRVLEVLCFVDKAAAELPELFRSSRILLIPFKHAGQIEHPSNPEELLWPRARTTAQMSRILILTPRARPMN